jgi:tRNA dimethylallyltransferase
MTGAGSDAAIDASGAPARIRVGFIVGPTGSGKSALAVSVAERLGAEIVNADSRQLYRGMDIGTAKPSCEERARVAHHLIDVATLDRPLDVAEFASLARGAIADIAARGRPPLVVGGSGLYVRALRAGIFDGPAASPEIRAEFAMIAAEHGVARLHEELARFDPDAARRIGPADAYRLVRALEVHRLSGEPISRHQARHGFRDEPYETLTVAILPDRRRLYDEINLRFDRMIAQGFIEEVRRLLDAGYAPDRPPLCTIGYKQMAAVLSGEMTLDKAVALAKRDSRRLAKRQLTWFRREQGIVWLHADNAVERATALFSAFFAARTACARGS